MKTIGLLSPNLDESKLVDARRLLPDDVRIHGEGFRVERYVGAAFADIETAVMDAFERIARQPLDFLMLTGELFFAHQGVRRHDEILDEIRGRMSCPASTVIAAVRAAFAELGLRRIVLAAPFTADQSAVIARFLTGEGLEVLGSVSLGHADPAAVWELAPETGYEAAAAALRRHPEAEGVYMPNNQWRITGIIETIEREFATPVVANTPAWTRQALAGMGITRPVAGYGRLLANRPRG